MCNTLKTLIAADELEIQKLIDFIQTFLTKNCYKSDDTNENFRTLENKLYELIQLVRFHQINGEEFMLKDGNGQYKIIKDSFLFSLSDFKTQTLVASLIFEGSPTVRGSATFRSGLTFGGFGGIATFRAPQTSGGIRGSHDLYFP
ncbi:13179_t:CDS:2, partial [Gigaspora margarita]